MAKKPDQDEAAKREDERKRRLWIESAAGMGLPAETIALLLVPPMDTETLKAQYAAELATGPAKVDLEAVSKLLAAIREGRPWAISLWVKNQMGWNEKGREKEKPPASEMSPPTTMPTAEYISAEILSFPRK